VIAYDRHAGPGECGRLSREERSAACLFEFFGRFVRGRMTMLLRAEVAATALVIALWFLSLSVVALRGKGRR